MRGSERLRHLFLLIAVQALLAGTAHAQIKTQHYILDNIFLEDGSPLTGSFEWTYAPGDFEGGSGVFTELEIPWRPYGTAPPLEEEGMIIIIENNQIEISLDGSFHDYGLNIIMKFVTPLSPTNPSPLDLETSYFECCGNGFKDQPFISGQITPVVPIGAEIDIDPDSVSNITHPHHDGSPAAIAGLNDIIPVVVFGQSVLAGDPADLDAATIDPATLHFGPAGGPVAAGSTPVVNDYDADGINDVSFEFLTGDTGISCLDTEATLTGATTANVPFGGTDSMTADCDALCHN